MENDDYFQDEEFSPIRSLLGLLTFSTILPIMVLFPFFQRFLKTGMAIGAVKE